MERGLHLAHLVGRSEVVALLRGYAEQIGVIVLRFHHVPTGNGVERGGTLGSERWS